MKPFVEVILTQHVLTPLKKRSQRYQPVGDRFTQDVGVFITLQIAGRYGQQVDNFPLINT